MLVGVVSESGGERGVDGGKQAWQVSVAVSVQGRDSVSAGSGERVSVRVSVYTVMAMLTRRNR